MGRCATISATIQAMKRLWLLFSQVVTAALAVYFVIAAMQPQWLKRSSPDLKSVTVVEAPPSDKPVPSTQTETLRSAARQAAPAVVSIVTNPDERSQQEAARRANAPRSPQQDEDMFSGVGSGVLVSAEGYILTNNHVTTGADQIVVALRDGRETLARVVGSDPETDLAVLKIDLKNLPAITLGRSDGLRVGDVALAIGNPFGVGQTVTMGIISATGRNQLGLNSYEDFIQTDAAINPGNSGGALVDANGNLTGINTAIFSKSGGSQGIGFAIPVKLAMEVMKSIIEHGQVIRGWLGIEVQPLTKELAESFGLTGRPGIVVAGIFRDGPAQKAGLQLGDVILSIDGAPAGDGRKSMNQVARIKPTDKVAILVMRNGKEIKLSAEIGLRPPPATAPVKEEQ